MLKIVVVPRHLTDKREGDIAICGAWRKQVNRVANLCHFREHDCRTGADKKISRIADTGVCGDAGEGVAASALETDDEIRCGTECPLTAVELFKTLLRCFEDCRHHVAEAVMLSILEANDEWFFSQDGK